MSGGSFKHKFLCRLLQGRLTLVKHVIHSMTTYSINSYNWPVSNLRTLEKACRNFILFGNIGIRKMCVVSWKKSDLPFSQGGLGLHSLVGLNETTNLKLLWDLINNKED